MTLTTPNELLINPARTSGSSARDARAGARPNANAAILPSQAREDTPFARELRSRREERDIEATPATSTQKTADEKTASLAQESGRPEQDAPHDKREVNAVESAGSQNSHGPASDTTDPDVTAQSEPQDVLTPAEPAARPAEVGPHADHVTTQAASAQEQSDAGTITPLAAQDSTLDADADTTARHDASIALAAHVAHAPPATTARWSQRAQVQFLSSHAVLAQAQISVASVNAAALRQAAPASEQGDIDADENASDGSAFESPVPQRPAQQALAGQASVVRPENPAASSSLDTGSQRDASFETGTKPPTPAANQPKDQDHPAQAGSLELGATRETSKAARVDIGVVSVLHASSEKRAATPSEHAGPGVGATTNTGKAARRSPIETLTKQAAPGREQVQQARMHAAAVRGVAMAFQAGGGDATLTLTPESLGRLKVHVQVRDGTVEATFQTSTPEAYAALRETHESLRASLETQGMQIERVVIVPPPSGQREHETQTHDERPGFQGQQPQQEQDGFNSRDQKQADRNAFGTRGAVETEGRLPTDLWNGMVPHTIVGTHGLEWMA